MRPEDSAIDVRLVDDDIAEIGEHVAPAVVVRQQADVDEIGIREDRVRGGADPPPVLGRRVAVVERRPEPRKAVAGERPKLVLRERLRRIQVQDAGLPVARDRVENREVEGKRLAGRRPGRDENVLAAARGFPRRRLMGVERRHTDGVARAVGQLVRQRHVSPRALGLGPQVGELLALEQPLPAEDIDCHLQRLARVTEVDEPRAVRVVQLAGVRLLAGELACGVLLGQHEHVVPEHSAY